MLGLKRFNFSPTSLGIFLDSPLLFYYKYLSFEKPDTNVPQAYGVAGNLVHDILENYNKHRDIKKATEELINGWEKRNIDNLSTINNKPLDKMDYHQALLYGIEIIDNKYDVIETEMKIELPIYEDIMKKGFIDVVCVNKEINKLTVMDYKTSNSVSKSSNFKYQVLFYCHLYYCRTGKIINDCMIEYLKLRKGIPYTFTDDEVVNFDTNVLFPIIEKIKTRLHNQRLYEIGDINNPFNDHLKKCRNELMARQISGCIQCVRMNNRLHFVSGLNYGIYKFLDSYFSYDFMNKEWVEAFNDGRWDGKKHFFRDNSLPYPFIHKIQELIDVYNNEFGTCYWLDIKDKRDFNVVNCKYETKFKDDVLTPRYYQKEVLQEILKLKIMTAFMGTACVDSETEFLTTSGWKKISEYTKGDKVMQYNIYSREANFVEPIEYIKNKSKGFYHIKTKYGLDQKISPEHRVPYVDYSGVIKTIIAEDLIKNHEKVKNGFKGKFILSFNKSDGFNYFEDKNEIRLITSIIADANIFRNKSNLRVNFNLKKENKINRLKEILESLNIEYNLNTNKLGYTRIGFNYENAIKEYKKEWYNLTKEELLVFAKESLLWDGNGKDSFYTTSKNNADFIQFCFNSNNFRTSITTKDRRGRIRKINGVSYTTKSIDYHVSVCKSKFTTITKGSVTPKREIKRVESKDGFEYCFRVPTGNLVLRRNDNVVITGNSGKTFVSSELIKLLNKRTLFLVNKVELVRQTAEEYENFLGVKIGRMIGGKFDIDNQITVASIQTIYAILKRNNKESELMRTYLYNVNVCIFDEAQGIKMSKPKKKVGEKKVYVPTMYEKIADHLCNVDFIVGLSGSPERENNETLEMNSLVGFIGYIKTGKELTKEGFLSPMKNYFMVCPQNEDKFEANDHLINYENFIVYNQARNNFIVDLVEKHRKKNKFLILVKSIKHGEILNELINNSYFLNGSTKSKERKEKYKEFKEGRDLVMISMTSIMSAGIDIPDLNVLINASANRSSNITVQSVGRPMRKCEGKEFGVYIDFFDEGLFQDNSTKRIKDLRKYEHDVQTLHISEIDKLEI